jgi:hypothetical protein
LESASYHWVGVPGHWTVSTILVKLIGEYLPSPESGRVVETKVCYIKMSFEGVTPIRVSLIQAQRRFVFCGCLYWPCSRRNGALIACDLGYLVEQV